MGLTAKSHESNSRTGSTAYISLQFTDEAVEMVMERLEALKDGKGD